jgi:hypothetical protein
VRSDFQALEKHEKKLSDPRNGIFFLCGEAIRIVWKGATKIPAHFFARRSEIKKESRAIFAEKNDRAAR